MTYIDAEAWKIVMRSRINVFGRAMGKLDHMRLHANTLDNRGFVDFAARKSFTPDPI
jgi:hypothetical protein